MEQKFTKLFEVLNSQCNRYNVEALDHSTAITLLQRTGLKMQLKILHGLQARAYVHVQGPGHVGLAHNYIGSYSL